MNGGHNLSMLENKIAVVTGASRGIGKSIAESLAAAGAHVILTSKKDGKDNLREVKDGIEAEGGEATVIPSDISDYDSVSRFFDEVHSRFSKIDLLINNAGTTVTKKAFDIDEKDWDHVLNTNLKGLFFSCQMAGKIMNENGGGKIVNISSVFGSVGTAAISPYTASKGGVTQLTKSLAIEWARHGIQVNAVAPGYVKTDMNADIFESSTIKDRIIKKIPMRRLGTTTEVASTVLFLCTDEASYITG